VKIDANTAKIGQLRGQRLYTEATESEWRIEMIIKAITALQAFSAKKVMKFRKEEDGLALTEYLVVLGLLVGGVIVAVGAFGDALSLSWGEWTSWIEGLDDPATAGTDTTDDTTGGT